jgi:IS5 family transposase
MGLGIMLRIHFLQQWFNLSDPAAEEALYDSPVLRRFAGVDLGRAPAPDETTILQFRHLLEKHDLGGAMLDTVNSYLDSRAASASRPAPLWTRPLFMRRRRRRTREGSAPRYRGLRKNHQRLCVNFALANLYLHRRRLAPLRA